MRRGRPLSGNGWALGRTEDPRSQEGKACDRGPSFAKCWGGQAGQRHGLEARLGGVDGGQEGAALSLVLRL